MASPPPPTTSFTKTSRMANTSLHRLLHQAALVGLLEELHLRRRRLPRLLHQAALAEALEDPRLRRRRWLGLICWRGTTTSCRRRHWFAAPPQAGATTTIVNVWPPTKHTEHCKIYRPKTHRVCKINPPYKTYRTIAAKHVTSKNIK